MCINVESLIREVEKKREIWDYSYEEFKDKKTKKTAWEEVYRALISDYDEMGEIDQENIGREIQMKWKNLKDSYKRNLRSQLEKGNTPDGKLLSTYIYSESMSFLKFEDLPIEIAILNIPGCINEADDSNNSIPFSDIEYDPALLTSKRKYTRKQKDVKLTEIKELTDDCNDKEDFISSNCDTIKLPAVEENLNCENFYAPDEDVAFFSSIIPTVRTLSFNEKLQFRMDVLQILTNIKLKDEKNLKRKKIS